MEEENSLAGRVLKGRYFPRSQMEESNIDYCPGYASRSIMSVKDLIQKGSRWRIGNGKKVKVYENRWIPTSLGFRFRSTRNILPENCEVEDLMDTELKTWNCELIYQEFEYEEATHIASISISDGVLEDKRIWHF